MSGVGRSYLAVDLGAESGRVVAGVLAGGVLRIREMARFPNRPSQIDGHLRWDVDSIYGEIEAGLRAASGLPPEPESVGVDTWGCDFVLLSQDGSPVAPPVTYRDARTEGMLERLFELVPAEEIYKRTGIQFMRVNTICQLLAMAEGNSPELTTARDLLLMPDYFNYLLTGVKASEFTDATTSQLFNIHDDAWDGELLGRIGVDPSLMQPVMKPATVLGDAIGFRGMRVVAPATHDTGSAVAATPARGEDWAYISSGTWSLMGIEVREPLVTGEAREFNFTNEGGVGGSYRFLKNIMGLWIVQRCRAALEQPVEYEELTRLAGEAPAFQCLLDVDDPGFLNPESMPAAIQAYAVRTGQRVPETPGGLVRCALESLALKYRQVLAELRRVSQRPISRIHILGGGARNRLLCGMTADATGLPVIAGPFEATAVGNILVQALGLGHLKSLEEVREVVRSSFELVEYLPGDAGAWESAGERLSEIRERR